MLPSRARWPSPRSKKRNSCCPPSLDVHEQLRNHVSGHECQTARYVGLAGLENGELLEAAERAGFDVLLTVDRGFEYQQNLGGRKIALVVFCGKSVLLEDLLALMPRCLKCLEAIQPGQVVRIGA